MLYSLDIETECHVTDCPRDSTCDHALYPIHALISCVGIWNPSFHQVFRDLNEFKAWVFTHPENTYVGHNLKFDLKHLHFHGVEIPKESWVEDTNLMAFCALEKIPDEWINGYETKRKELNKDLPKAHRKAGQHSLKTLAPYFLKVPAFYEDPSNHNLDEYVLKDAEYTYRLYEYFKPIMEKEGTHEFYQKHLLPWTKMLLRAELKGVRLDTQLLDQSSCEALEKTRSLERQLHESWGSALASYRQSQISLYSRLYLDKQKAAEEKTKDLTEEKRQKIKARYDLLLKKAIERLEPFNFASPTQMLWLLRDYFGLDTKVEVRDKVTNIRTIEDSTGVEVLQRLADQGREDIKIFLDYREQVKLLTSFLPTYKQALYRGRVHTTFNPTGTRTGRLSSSGFNAQQIPSGLYPLFIADDGYELASYDMAAIEAKLISYYSEDPMLTTLVMTGADLHGHNVKLLFNLECDVKDIKKLHPEKRQFVKNFFFAILYGAGWRRIQQESVKHGFNWTDQECKQKLALIKDSYPGVFEFKKEIDQIAAKAPIQNLLGRKIFFQNPEDIYMKAFNTLIQGSASDLVCQSSFRIMERFKKAEISGEVILLIHDCIVSQIPIERKKEALEIIETSMTDYELVTALGPIKLQVEGTSGPCWTKG